MTVKEFIKELRKCDPNAEIVSKKPQYYDDVEEWDAPVLSDSGSTVHIY